MTDITHFIGPLVSFVFPRISMFRRSRGKHQNSSEKTVSQGTRNNVFCYIAEVQCKVIRQGKVKGRGTIA